MSSPSQIEEWLSDLLHGDASESTLRALADEAKSDPELAERIRLELEFSEILRVAVKDGNLGASPDFFESKAAFEQSEEDLFAKVCDGQISEVEGNQLAKSLLDNPEKVALLKRRLSEDEWMREALSLSRSEDSFVEALETRMWAETRQDHFVDDFRNRLDREVTAQEAAVDNLIELPVSWAPTVWKMAAVAAVVSLGAFFVAQLGVKRLPSAEAVAQIVKTTDDVRWVGTQVPGPEGQVETGRYELERGIVALRFAEGGEMSIEGPALFEVKDDETAHVHYGIAMARNEEPDSGIRLKSNGLIISEPVPLIGIDARSEYSTEAIVFAGDGGICSEDGNCRSLFEFEAIKADRTRDRLVDIPYNPRPFEAGWGLLSGVEKN
ncbi:MAG: hypothetical protein AAF491_11665, partial [Verrucomicrobiota bacterium]